MKQYKNQNALGYSVIPNWLMERREVSFGAKLIYARLRQHLGANPDAWPKQETLAKEIAASTQQVKRFIAELKAYRLVETFRPMGRSQSNHYRFPVHKWELEVSKLIPREVSKLIPPLNNYIEKQETTLKTANSPLAISTRMVGLIKKDLPK